MPTTHPLEEPLAPDPTPGAVTRRALAWGALGVVLAGATASRLTGAAPATADAPRAAVELVSLSFEEAARELRASSLDPIVRADMLVAIKERRLHLVRAPFYGVGGAVGAWVTVTCGTLVRPLVLTAAPTSLLLPIERAGRIVVTARAAMAEGARIGLVTASLPVTLPPPGPAESLILDVIVL